MTTTANNTSTGTIRRFFTRCLTTTGEQHEQVGSILAIAARQHHICVSGTLHPPPRGTARVAKLVLADELAVRVQESNWSTSSLSFFTFF